MDALTEKLTQALDANLRAVHAVQHAEHSQLFVAQSFLERLDETRQRISEAIALAEVQQRTLVELRDHIEAYHVEIDRDATDEKPHAGIFTPDDAAVAKYLGGDNAVRLDLPARLIKSGDIFTITTKVTFDKE